MKQFGLVVGAHENLIALAEHPQRAVNAAQRLRAAVDQPVERHVPDHQTRNQEQSRNGHIAHVPKIGMAANGLAVPFLLDLLQLGRVERGKACFKHSQ